MCLVAATQGAHQRAHFTSITDTVTTPTITQGPDVVLDPRALLRKPVCVATGNNKYPSLTHAISLAEELDILATPERIRTLENLMRRLPTSTGSSMTSSETLREMETVSSDVPSASISLSSPDTSREPSPIRSGTAALRLGRTKAPSPLTTDGEDPLFLDEEEPVPPPKCKRTLKERLAPTLREHLDDPMDEADDTVSLGLTDAEEEIDDFFERTWYCRKFFS
ncbi:hypothetical protein DICSQDRAFT_170830 [Dichomitus squalens LYAD-421 SS1]|uniref:Uncharacterized protein n=1 Tax=Dichomitus squalens (strain LYAD-421) TaxID=732165 RepID=R7SX86_DICSQ|nr:uncharacterized protein DICSQDRAFT_170830 [Dichomitus squalens LYAD-421 SS1]EJF60681.1 hypothetical protein DICSQDRAFT_170830 [Dichomitus squalens LYAD-421 SS1]